MMYYNYKYKFIFKIIVASLNNNATIKFSKITMYASTAKGHTKCMDIMHNTLPAIVH